MSFLRNIVHASPTSPLSQNHFLLSFRHSPLFTIFFLKGISHTSCPLYTSPELQLPSVHIPLSSRQTFKDFNGSKTVGNIVLKKKKEKQGRKEERRLCRALFTGCISIQVSYTNTTCSATVTSATHHPTTSAAAFMSVLSPKLSIHLLTLQFSFHKTIFCQSVCIQLHWIFVLEPSSPSTLDRYLTTISISACYKHMFNQIRAVLAHTSISHKAVCVIFSPFF